VGAAGWLTATNSAHPHHRITHFPATAQPPNRPTNPPNTPQGGRNNKNPILREDVFLLKVKALGGYRGKKKAAPADPDADPFGDDGTEFGEGRSQAQLAMHRGLAAVLEPAWKNNPNERKLSRSNRRG
jgi:hypothetical protein